MVRIHKVVRVYADLVNARRYLEAAVAAGIGIAFPPGFDLDKKKLLSALTASRRYKRTYAYIINTTSLVCFSLSLSSKPG